MEVTRNKFSVFKASTADPTMVKAVKKMETDHTGALWVTAEKCQFLSSCEESISSTSSTGLGSFTLTLPFISENLESSLGNDSPSRPRKARHLSVSATSD